ncbi:HAD family hydrolase [Helicobacter zhangjianzhongii]|uniref:Haloacid dehalogenase-like hydrolase n=1 Tax=Helicobacter zhangjianzhongii TaxID=2974574 RepID=A0ACC6FSQ2_9HELI|nr:MULTISPECIES: haloacid dehalogenase-like hydrolase [unclassified Helicobacter]MDL0079793.1 haloacid dehalogenase-like hydrolase [Helicobacter sp. CPD2-1]MDL0082112.1 haloacid dehalogenase-like hydrolase [Helicobacter sp. XJK30-2]
MNIAFFDFDGTMAKGDSLLAFVAFVRGKKRLYWGLFSRCFILIGYALGLISNTKAKQALMRYFFAGMDYKEFLQECERFCPELESRLKPAALARLQWHKDRGDRVVMVSASFEEYLAPLCARLGMECIGTRLATQLKKVDSRGDSVLGRHSADFRDLEAAADSCSAAKTSEAVQDGGTQAGFFSKSLKSYKSPTAKRSFFRKQAIAVQGEAAAGFFRTPRILEDTNWGSLEKSTENTKVDSSKQAYFSVIASRDSGVAIHNQKVDSRNNAQNVEISQNEKAESVFDNQAAGGRIFHQNKQSGVSVSSQVSLEKSNAKTLESTFVSGEFATPNCYGEQKAVRIRARYDLSNYAEIYAYGDSKGDRAMLELATHAFYKPF